MSNSQPQAELSVVILCYKSGEFAREFTKRVIETLEASNISSYELVLVGNYMSGQRDTDPTPAVVRELAASNPRIVAVVKEKEGMMSWDMRTGLDAATGKYIAVIDGDGQMPPEDVVKVYRALLSGPYDMAKTYRDTRFDGWRRVVVSRIYNLFTKILFPKVCARDLNSKPKVFTREALAKLTLTSDGWFIDAEMMLKGTYLGFQIIEAPTTFYPNANRQSFVSSSALLESVLNLLRYRLRLFRGHF